MFRINGLFRIYRLFRSYRPYRTFGSSPGDHLNSFWEWTFLGLNPELMVHYIWLQEINSLTLLLLDCLALTCKKKQNKKNFQQDNLNLNKHHLTSHILSVASENKWGNNLTLISWQIKQNSHLSQKLTWLAQVAGKQSIQVWRMAYLNLMWHLISYCWLS